MLVVTYLDTRKIAVGKKYIGREMTTVVHLAKSLTPTSITNTHTTYYISHILYYITIYPTIQNNTCYYLIAISIVPLVVKRTCRRRREETTEKKRKEEEKKETTQIILPTKKTKRKKTEATERERKNNSSRTDCIARMLCLYGFD